MTWDAIYLRAAAGNFDEALRIAETLDIGVELQMFTQPASYSKDVEGRIKRYAAGLAGFEGPLSYHAPFIDVSLTSPDKYIREYSRGLLDFGVETAYRLGAKRLIFHSGFNPLIAYKEYKEGYPGDIARVLEPYLEKAAVNGLSMYVENIFESGPGIVGGIARSLNSPRFKVCLDVGHANIFSDIPLTDWVGELGTLIGYVHLHDNGGVYDDHLPPGEGFADIKGVLGALSVLGPSPAISLEIKADMEAVSRTVAILRSYNYR